MHPHKRHRHWPFPRFLANHRYMEWWCAGDRGSCLCQHSTPAESMASRTSWWMMTPDDILGQAGMTQPTRVHRIASRGQMRTSPRYIGNKTHRRQSIQLRSHSRAYTTWSTTLRRVDRRELLKTFRSSTFRIVHRSMCYPEQAPRPVDKYVSKTRVCRRDCH